MDRSSLASAPHPFPSFATANLRLRRRKGLLLRHSAATYFAQPRARNLIDLSAMERGDRKTVGESISR